MEGTVKFYYVIKDYDTLGRFAETMIMARPGDYQGYLVSTDYHPKG